MALTLADLARLGLAAQKQVLDKLAGTLKPGKSKYGNREYKEYFGEVHA